MSRSRILLFGLLISGCAEALDSEYPNVSAAREDGAIARCWVPSWIPESAKKIHEFHDIDTNQSMLAAKYDDAEPIRWNEHCEQIEPLGAPSPPFRRLWWASDVPASQFSTHRHAYFKCGPNAYAAWGQGEFYFWRP